jgi:predicted DNA-binding transcriptional regulator AlpA
MKLLTRPEAAERCRVSLAAFDAHVRPSLTPKKIGRRVLFLESDLDAWAESLANEGKTKPGRSAAPVPTRSGNVGSPLLAALLSDPRASAMKEKLTRRPRESSLQLAPASSETQAQPGAVVLPLRSRTS